MLNTFAAGICSGKDHKGLSVEAGSPCQPLSSNPVESHASGGHSLLPTCWRLAKKWCPQAAARTLVNPPLEPYWRELAHLKSQSVNSEPKAMKYSAPGALPLFLFLLVLAWPSSGRAIDLWSSANFPPDLALVQQATAGKDEPDTQCSELRRRSSRQLIGLLCTSSSTEFKQNFGILQVTSDDEGFDQGTKFAVATGMSMYGMTGMSVHGRTLYTAEVDCDEGAGPVYRATSTCHIGVMPLDNDKFLYGNFVMTNHVTREHEMREAQILDIWRSVEVPID